MRPLLGTLALLLVLAGCGSDTASDVGSGDDQDPSDAPTAAGTTVTIVSATSGRGDPATRATFLASDGALASYVQQFDDGFAAAVTEAADGVEVDDGEVLIAQVVSIGCDKPVDASVRTFEDGVAIVPTPVPTPHMECVAAVTSVGLAAVPVSLEGGGR
ncbi:hypothetical protein [Nocardioides sp.]|uniref:hypothetical protein n=1 Tax=Nocardioides sp. TaxID=35761 RepID=UPI00378383A0